MTGWKERTEQARPVDSEPSSNGQHGPTPLERLEWAALTTTGLRNLTPPAPLIDGLLWLDSTAMLYGPSGVGKSFLALDWVLHVVTGSWWHGHKVTPVPAVYLAAEGVARLGARVDAWCRHHGIHDLDRHQPIHWLPLGVTLHRPEWAGALAEFVKARDARLVVVDTLARCAVGADENTARDAGLIVEGLDQVRRATAAASLALHHSGKDLSAGARGNSAFKGAMDTELELVGTEDRATLKVTKQKDAAELPPIRLRRVAVGGSCVLIPDRGGDPTELSDAALATLEALRNVEVPGGVSTSVWRLAVDAPERTFYRHRQQLLTASLVENVGTEKTPRYQVKDDGH